MLARARDSYEVVLHPSQSVAREVGNVPAERSSFLPCATGVEGVVEIESEWTARMQKQNAIVAPELRFRGESPPWQAGTGHLLEWLSWGGPPGSGVGRIALSQRSTGSVQWKVFVYQGKRYDLSHLDPFEIQFEHPAQDGKPAVRFRVDVRFSLHCFSRRLDDGPHDRCLIYPNVSEIRLFDPYRYELSWSCVRESAYVRDPSYKTSRPAGKPIRFWVILHNSLNGLAIRT